MAYATLKMQVPIAEVSFKNEAYLSTIYFQREKDEYKFELEPGLRLLFDQNGKVCGSFNLKCGSFCAADVKIYLPSLPEVTLGNIMFF